MTCLKKVSEDKDFVVYNNYIVQERVILFL
jgi:hypothetical protein